MPALKPATIGQKFLTDCGQNRPLTTTYIVPTQLGNTKGITANSDIYGNPLFDKSSDTFDSILISPKAFEYILEHLIDLEYFVDQRELYRELYC